MKTEKIIYGNWKVYDLNNELIFRASEDKVNWYLKKNLATLIDEKSIKLNFEPNGNCNRNDSFYLADKENKCVVCASNLELTKHHIVPYCFRKLFPDNIKKHSSHDIVPLCRICHDKYEVFAWQTKIELCEKYNINIDSGSRNKFIKKNNNYLFNLENLLVSENVPEDKKNVIKTKIAKLKEELKINKEELKAISWSKIIVDKYKDNLFEFIIFWRKHFINNMNPEYMPKNWNVDLKNERK